MIIAVNAFIQRHEFFMTIQKSFSNQISISFIQDVKTRWNNIYDMMKRALRFKMNIHIWLTKTISKTNTMNRRNKKLFQKFLLSKEEWNHIKYLMNLLCSFRLCTKMIDKSQDFIIHLTFTVYNKLFDHLKN